jgi:hypothetical protein
LLEPRAESIRNPLLAFDRAARSLSSTRSAFPFLSFSVSIFFLSVLFEAAALFRPLEPMSPPPVGHDGHRSELYQRPSTSPAAGATPGEGGRRRTVRGGKRPEQEGGAAAAVGRDGGGSSTPVPGREERERGARCWAGRGRGVDFQHGEAAALTPCWERCPRVEERWGFWVVDSWASFVCPCVGGGMRALRLFFFSIPFFSCNVARCNLLIKNQVSFFYDSLFATFSILF